MKKLLVVFTLLFCCLGCEKNENQNDTSGSIVGVWKMTNCERNVYITSNIIVSVNEDTSHIETVNFPYVSLLCDSVVFSNNDSVYSNCPWLNTNWSNSYLKVDNSLFIKSGNTVNSYSHHCFDEFWEYDITLLDENYLSFSGTNPMNLMLPRHQEYLNLETLEMDFPDGVILNIDNDCNSFSYYCGDTLFESFQVDSYELEKVE